MTGSLRRIDPPPARRYPESPMAFPQTRLRRLRATPVLRDLVRETRLHPGDFVAPLFVEAGLDGRQPIAAMPGVDRLSISYPVLFNGIKKILANHSEADKDQMFSGTATRVYRL